MIDIAAIYRLVRLIVWDTFPPVASFREKMLSRGDNIGYLFKCPWCMSFWIAIVALCVKKITPKFWEFISEVLALSCFAGLISEIERTIYREHNK